MSALLPRPSEIHLTDCSGHRVTSNRLGFVGESIVDFSSVAGLLYVECLARMLVPEATLLRGADFVPELEAKGAIALLDVAIVEMVLDALAGNADISLGCNISPRTLADPDAWERVIATIASMPIPARRLVLEITESAPLSAISDVGRRLSEAKRLGCRLAIDDFGVGFAVESEVSHANVDWDIVKIDRSFLIDEGDVPHGRQLTSLVERARSLGPVVVVEGIETADQLVMAREAGAHGGQGRLFEAPMIECWSSPDNEKASQLSCLLMRHGATLQPVQGSPQDFLLSRVDNLGSSVRALAAQVSEDL